jgi:ribonuclease Z
LSVRELVVLGTASQVPTRRRNHNGYVLRWDGEGILFDPGEGTQRQMTYAGVSGTEINRICVTHLHGDHCLGLPGVIQRLSHHRVSHPVDLHFPASGSPYIERLRHAAIFDEFTELRVRPQSPGVIAETGGYRLEARALDHTVDTIGYRLTEPDGRRMLPDRLDACGITGPDISRLQERGWLDVDGRRIELEDVSAPRPGQRFAFVMDTRLCDEAFELAEGADLLVCEATFLESEAELADEYGHLTARQAARIAAEAGARKLVLSHFSQRYPDDHAFLSEARDVFDEVVVARDVSTIEVPRRMQVEA